MMRKNNDSKWATASLILSGLLSIASLAVEPGYCAGTDLIKTPPPLEAESVKPLPELNRLFDQRHGWVGADGAFSVPIGLEETIWTFGDTWIGDIEGSKRIKVDMINNTVARGKLHADETKPSGIEYGDLTFYWDKSRPKPDSIWKARDKEYVWPGDGAFVDGRLYVFLHRIRTNLKLPPPFQFETVGHDLVVIDNPQEEPAKWRQRSVSLPWHPEAVHAGAACYLQGNYLFVFCTAPRRKSGMNPHPLILARIERDSLAELNLENMEFFAGGATWTSDPEKASILFEDAGPEMSVGRVKGIEGVIAVYMPPLSKDIAVRRAPCPEGPWSAATRVYNCPEKEDNVILYSAKGHSELSARERSLVVTYCRNTKDMESHFNNASIYFPRALLIRFAPDKR
ncbi:MAG: DUF4185 domain-containing protein [Candidatus Obscuribacterales bacterium]